MQFLIELFLIEYDKASNDRKAYSKAANSFSPHMEELMLKPKCSTNLVNYYMANAIKLLASIPLSDLRKKDFIYIFPHNSDEILYLWTAFVYLGSIIPNHNITPKAIRLPYNWSFKEQLGYFWLFSSDSLFEKEFKDNIDGEIIKNYLSNDPILELEKPFQFKYAYDPISERQKADQQRRAQVEKRKAEAEQKKFCSAIIHRSKTQPVLLLTVVENYLSNSLINIDDIHPYTGNTYVVLCLIHQQEMAAEYLIRQGANVLIKNKAGKKALDYVSESSHLHSLIIEKEEESHNKELPNSIRYGKLCLEEILHIGTRLSSIKKYLESGADINYQDENKYTLLMHAVDLGKERIAEYLINQGANVILKNKNELIASDLASENSFIYTLLKKAERNYQLLDSLMIEKQDASGDKELSNSLRYGKLCLKEILPLGTRLSSIKNYIELGADINYQDENKYTLLMHAVVLGKVLIVEYLIAQGANVILKNKNGLVASDLARENSFTYTLLKKAEQNYPYRLLSSNNSNSSELLLDLVKSGKSTPRAIEELLNSKADINYQDKQGITALMYATSLQNQFIADYLLSRGANPESNSSQVETESQSISPSPL